MLAIIAGNQTGHHEDHPLHPPIAFVVQHAAQRTGVVNQWQLYRHYAQQPIVADGCNTHRTINNSTKQRQRGHQHHITG